MIKTLYLKNADLTFKSRTCNWRHVNSHPRDGVDLCQLCYCNTVFL